MSSPEQIYDIFAGVVDSEPIWLLAISGLRTATEIMNRLAAQSPGPYFIFDSISVSIIDSTNTRPLRRAV